MLKLLILEFYKLKRSWIFVCAIAGIFISPLLSTMMSYTWSAQDKTKEFLLANILNQNQLFSCLMINILLFSLIITYLINREYQEKTISYILTVPISKFMYLSSKIIISLLCVFLLTGLSFVFAMLLGIIFQAKGLNGELIFSILKSYYKGAVLLTPCIITSIFIANLSKNYIVPIAFSIIMVVINIFILNHKTYSYFFPWLIPGLLSINNMELDMKLVPWSYTITAGFTVLITAVTYVHFRISDVD